MNQGKAPKEPAPAKSNSLERVLNQSEGIKERVEEAATTLASVHVALKQEVVAPPAQTVDEAVVQIEAVEEEVVKAAEDLHEVNGALAREVAQRTALESELADTKGDLVDARDDLARSRANEEESRQTSLQDPVTGLSNRALFDQRLAHGLIQAKRHGWGLAIIFIDIDKFKSVNDVHGHDLGDKVLLMVANRLRASVRGEDTVSRWGGDEFACILLGVKQEADVARIAENLVTRITEDCDCDGTVLSVGASLGVAVYPQDGETPDILFKNADRAMYRAKETGKAVMLFHQMASDCP